MHNHCRSSHFEKELNPIEACTKREGKKQTDFTHSLHIFPRTLIAFQYLQHSSSWEVLSHTSLTLPT